MSFWSLSRLALPVALFLSACSVQALTIRPPGLSVEISPSASDANDQIPEIAIRYRIDELGPREDGAILRLPVLESTVPTSANRMEGMTFSDADGDLPVRTEDVIYDDANSARFWYPEREIIGPVEINWQISIETDVPGLVAPQYELRTTENSVSGSMLSFLPLPLDGVERQVGVSWDMANADEGAVGVSSLGIGDVTTDELINPSSLSSVYIMAGTPGVFESDATGFFAAWQGTPAFPGEGLMSWADGLQQFYGDFFEYAPESFGVFGRHNPANPGSGIGLRNSFAFTFGAETPIDNLKSLLAHEMLHAWVRGFDGLADGTAALASSWYSEGLAVHYQRLLPWRAGLMSDEEFLYDLNSTAARYYTNIMINVPNEDVPAGFWRDTRIRVLPYDRGSLYFAALNADIQAATNGDLSLDDLVREMLSDRRADIPLTEAHWREKLEAVLGEDGIADFDAMLAGGEVQPPSDAFGPCFQRVTKPLRRYNLGFDPDVLLDRPREVYGLIPGSEADKAGLRDGDVILHSFSQDGMQGDQDAWLQIRIDRDGEELTLRYQPRGETVDAYQWEKTSDEICATR